ncbi:MULTISPECIES: hypothetical protein [Kribbella]|uniref:hypothetical protein n=1 Tax=Kribbella TaxID=182639 RepID=UPI00104EC75C|nr:MULTISPECIES: hypothetical protein [Kribbella]
MSTRLRRHRKSVPGRDPDRMVNLLDIRNVDDRGRLLRNQQVPGDPLGVPAVVGGRHHSAHDRVTQLVDELVVVFGGHAYCFLSVDQEGPSGRPVAHARPGRCCPTRTAKAHAVLRLLTK